MNQPTWLTRWALPFGQRPHPCPSPRGEGICARGSDAVLPCPRGEGICARGSDDAFFAWGGMNQPMWLKRWSLPYGQRPHPCPSPRGEGICARGVTTPFFATLEGRGYAHGGATLFCLALKGRGYAHCFLPSFLSCAPHCCGRGVSIPTVCKRRCRATFHGRQRQGPS